MRSSLPCLGAGGGREREGRNGQGRVRTGERSSRRGRDKADKEGTEAPPNPLQHKTPRTTHRCYVALEESDWEFDEDYGD